jgi:hypothetical protein
VVEVERIADSCGYAVHCTTTPASATCSISGQDKDDADLAAYRTQRNHKSIDGLPALPMAAGDRRRAWAESGFTSCRLQQECSLETVDRS